MLGEGDVGLRSLFLLGSRRVGSFTRDGIGCTVEKKLYGGRGLGLVGSPNVAILVFQMGGFTVGK